VRSDTPVLKANPRTARRNFSVAPWSPGLEFGLEFIRIADGQQALPHYYVQDLQTLTSLVPATAIGSGDEAGLQRGDEMRLADAL
jgi:hypothetical protein